MHASVLRNYSVHTSCLTSTSIYAIVSFVRNRLDYSVPDAVHDDAQRVLVSVDLWSKTRLWSTV
jgi:hypothetical protein